jgi:hypothetical protein
MAVIDHTAIWALWTVSWGMCLSLAPEPGALYVAGTGLIGLSRQKTAVDLHGC